MDAKMDSTPHAQPSRRSALRKTLIVLPLVLLLATGWLWYTSQNRVQLKLDALKAQGLPTTASELNEFYKVPAGVTDRSHEWVSAIDALLKSAVSKPLNSLQEVGLNSNPIPPPGQLWTEYEATRQLMGELDKELQRIREAASVAGQVRYPVDYSLGLSAPLFDHFQGNRQVARFLVLDAYLGAHEGKHARILDDIKSIDALSDTLSSGPFLITSFVRLAIYAVGISEIEKWLAYCDWSDAELASLQEAILSAQFEQEIARCLIGERASGLTQCNKFILGPFRESVLTEYLRVQEEAIDSFSHPWPEPLERQAALTARLNGLQKQPLSSLRYHMVTSSGPAIEQAGNAVARAVAKQRCICLLIAAQRFRLQQGRLPHSLGEIERSQLGQGAELPDLFIDPFDGKPLRFKSDAEGIVVYSVSENRMDDGGEIQSPTGRNLDVGFKLLKAKAVNQPDGNK